MSTTADPNSPIWLIFIAITLVTSIFYIAPTVIVIARQHPQWLFIAIVNLVFGVTGIAWVLAFIWSIMPIKKNESK